MIILMDCDGPLADFIGGLLAALVHDSHAVPTPADVTQWDVFALLNSTALMAARTKCQLADFWSSLPVTPGAASGMAALRNAGHKIIVVTSAYESCRSWESVRREWLLRNFGIPCHDVIVTSRKDLVHGDLLIDDKPAHVAAFHGDAALFDLPHNRGFDAAGHARVGWPEIVGAWATARTSPTAHTPATTFTLDTT